MKMIISLCTVLALLVPTYAFAHGDTMYRLQRQWAIEEAQQQQVLPSIKGIETDAAKSMKSFELKYCANFAIQPGPINSK